MATHSLPWDDAPPSACRDGALSIGNFDGVHRGHAALMAELRRQAMAVHGPAVAITFDPHPGQLLRPGVSPPPLTTMAERARLLHAAGADHVVILQTTPELLRLSAEEFFDRVIRGHFAARALVEGSNFRFGRDRGGDVTTLADLCARHGMTMDVVEPILVDGEPVSSSRARLALERGAVDEAAACLGRPYALTGTVGRGQRRGNTLGFPTANLEQVETVVPADGVYAVRAWHEGRAWPAAANIGPNPTFGEGRRKIEAHLIDFSDDLYDQSLTVEFLQRLRDTRPFRDATELVAQLREDVARAREVAAP